MGWLTWALLVSLAVKIYDNYVGIAVIVSLHAFASLIDGTRARAMSKPRADTQADDEKIIIIIP